MMMAALKVEMKVVKRVELSVDATAAEKGQLLVVLKVASMAGLMVAE